MPQGMRGTWYPRSTAEQAELDWHVLEVARLLGAKGEHISPLGVRARLSRTVGTKWLIASLARLHVGGWIEPFARNRYGRVKSYKAAGKALDSLRK